MREKQYGAEPRRVSDIEISRVFEVVCEECGVIDAPRSYKTAIMSRRDHWFGVHKEARDVA